LAAIEKEAKTEFWW